MTAVESFFHGEKIKMTETASKPLRVLMVCMGNICRSSTAQGVLEHLVAQKNLQHAVQVDSAGTHGYQLADRRMHAASNMRVRAATTFLHNAPEKSGMLILPSLTGFWSWTWRTNGLFVHFALTCFNTKSNDWPLSASARNTAHPRLCPTPTTRGRKHSKPCWTCARMPARSF